MPTCCGYTEMAAKQGRKGTQTDRQSDRDLKFRDLAHSTYQAENKAGKSRNVDGALPPNSWLGTVRSLQMGLSYSLSLYNCLTLNVLFPTFCRSLVHLDCGGFSYSRILWVCAQN